MPLPAAVLKRGGTMELLTAAEMRAAEDAAIGGGRVSGLALMERAAAAVVAAVEAAGLGREGPVAVFCGPGANGGDGFAIARRLAERGRDCAVFLRGDPDRLPPDAAETWRLWREWGPAAPFAPGDGRRRWGLVVDALFGTGLSRPLAPDVAEAWRALAAPAPVVAVDAPSGLCLDTGRDRGVPAAADLTVTFHRPKRGHYLGAGPDLCGRLVVADIGLDPGPAVARLAAPDARRLAKQGAAHKYDHGHALVLAGGPGRGGAARLAARAALRAGAGLVTVGAPTAAIPENAARLDAVMLRPLDDAAALEDALADPRISATLLGPGLGLGKRARAATLAALRAGQGRTVVLDADALTAFAEDPAALFAACRDRAVVMTPHGGEFSRLWPDLAARLADPGDDLGRIGAVEAAAARSGATVLLKGRDTVIAGPAGGPVAVSAAAYDRAAPWLATAGSGDVLAGLVAGLAARGFAPLAAAETASWLHVEAARRFGPGLIAEDLTEAVPAALAAALGASGA